MSNCRSLFVKCSTSICNPNIHYCSFYQTFIPPDQFTMGESVSDGLRASCHLSLSVRELDCTSQVLSQISITHLLFFTSETHAAALCEVVWSSLGPCMAISNQQLRLIPVPRYRPVGGPGCTEQPNNLIKAHGMAISNPMPRCGTWVDPA